MKLAFGDCVLDLSARQLVRQGSVVSLEPKMYELLETLIRRRGAVVTNSELDEILWPNVYVARTSLTRLVSELRAVLGDTPRDSRIIRTVYKSGYAFCAEVSTDRSARQRSAHVELIWNRQVIPVSDGEHIAGRDPLCTLVIDADSVSRRHARITVVCGTATIEDLESTNGTRVNGKRISTPTRLAAGNEIALGSEILRLRMRDPSAPTIKVDSDRDARDGSRRKDGVR